MKKNDLIINVTTEDPEATVREMNKERDRIYAMNLWMLQEKAGLSFKEARVHLSNNREFFCNIAEEYGITTQAVYNIQRRAEKKIKDSGLTPEQIFGEDRPYTFLIS
jgi:hypothetical protein